MVVMVTDLSFFFLSLCMKTRNLFLQHLPLPSLLSFTLLPLRKCCWKFLHLFHLLPPTPVQPSPYTSHTLSHQPFSCPLQPPCCSVHQAVCTSVCPALAIVKIWPKKKCVHGEEDKDGWLWKEERKGRMQKILQHESLFLTHPHVPYLTLTALYTYPLLFWKTTPSPSPLLLPLALPKLAF